MASHSSSFRSPTEGSGAKRCLPTSTPSCTPSSSALKLTEKWAVAPGGITAVSGSTVYALEALGAEAGAKVMVAGLRKSPVSRTAAVTSMGASEAAEANSSDAQLTMTGNGETLVVQKVLATGGQPTGRAPHWTVGRDRA